MRPSFACLLAFWVASEERVFLVLASSKSRRDSRSSLCWSWRGGKREGAVRSAREKTRSFSQSLLDNEKRKKVNRITKQKFFLFFFTLLTPSTAATPTSTSMVKLLLIMMRAILLLVVVALLFLTSSFSSSSSSEKTTKTKTKHLRLNLQLSQTTKWGGAFFPKK